MEVLFSCLQFNHELFQFIPARSNGLINSHTLQCTIPPFPCSTTQCTANQGRPFYTVMGSRNPWHQHPCGDEMELHAWNHCMGNYCIPSQLRRFKFSFFVVGEGIITQPSLGSHFHNSDNDTLTPENYLIKLIKLSINLISLLFVSQPTTHSLNPSPNQRITITLI